MINRVIGSSTKKEIIRPSSGCEMPTDAKSFGPFINNRIMIKISRKKKTDQRQFAKFNPHQITCLCMLRPRYQSLKEYKEICNNSWSNADKASYYLMSSLHFKSSSLQNCVTFCLLWFFSLPVLIKMT
jgi:hypothetical protein